MIDKEQTLQISKDKYEGPEDAIWFAWYINRDTIINEKYRTICYTPLIIRRILWRYFYYQQASFKFQKWMSQASEYTKYYNVLFPCEFHPGTEHHNKTSQLFTLIVKLHQLHVYQRKELMNQNDRFLYTVEKLILQQSTKTNKKDMLTFFFIWSFVIW